METCIVKYCRYKSRINFFFFRTLSHFYVVSIFLMIRIHLTPFNSVLRFLCTFLDNSPTFIVPLILSFPILSSLVTPLIHLYTLISTTSNFFSCAFFTAHVSAPYIIAGLTTVCYTFPLTLKLILR